MAIWTAFRGIYQLIPPDRNEPLMPDDGNETSNDLNAIYINIRGAMDNFAWCLQYILGDANSLNLLPAQIGLFNPVFLRQDAMRQIDKLLEPFKSWNKNFKERRDPAAHRVPLSIIRQILDPASQSQFREIGQRVSQFEANLYHAIGEKDYAESEKISADIDALRSEQQSLGKFRPFFEFDPAKSPIPLYPTLSSDVGKYVLISRKLIDFLKNTLKEP